MCTLIPYCMLKQGSMLMLAFSCAFVQPHRAASMAVKSLAVCLVEVLPLSHVGGGIVNKFKPSTVNKLDICLNLKLY